MDEDNRDIYLCGGRPECFGNPGCGLCGRGQCYATTFIEYARNRYAILNNPKHREGAALAHVPRISPAESFDEIFLED